MDKTVVLAFCLFYLTDINPLSVSASNQVSIEAHSKNIRHSQRISIELQKSIVNQQVSILSKEYHLPFKNIESVFQALNVLNKAPKLKKTVDETLCHKNYGFRSRLLATTLKAELKRDVQKSSCVKPAHDMCHCLQPLLEQAASKICRCVKIIHRGKRSTEVTGDLRTSILTEMGISREGMYGITVHKGYCTYPGEDTDIDTKNMCKECYYQVILPPNYVPQIHLHVACGGAGENSCLTHQGVCAKIKRTQTIVKVSSTNHILEEFDLSVTTGCQCEIRKGSPFEPFVD